MSWGIAASWAMVAGSLFLTAGTGAQAWANLTEYRDSLWTISDETFTDPSFQALAEYLPDSALNFIALMLIRATPSLRDLMRFLASGGTRALILAILRIPRKMTRIRQAGGEDAARLAELLRLAAVWTVLMAGSAFVLAGAVIQLVLGYTS